MRIPACVDWLLADWDDKKWYVKLAEVVSMSLAIYEVIFLGGMIWCMVEEIMRQGEYMRMHHQMLGGSANVRLWRENTCDLIEDSAECNAIADRLNYQNDSLVAHARSPTFGWFDFHVSRLGLKSEPVHIDIRCKKTFENEPLHTPDDFCYFELSFALSKNGGIASLPLFMRDTLNSHYMYHPVKFKTDKQVWVFEDQPESHPDEY